MHYLPAHEEVRHLSLNPVVTEAAAPEAGGHRAWNVLFRIWLHVSDEWTEESHEDVWAYGTCPKTAPKEVAAQLLRTAWQG